MEIFLNRDTKLSDVPISPLLKLYFGKYQIANGWPGYILNQNKMCDCSFTSGEDLRKSCGQIIKPLMEKKKSQDCA